MDEEFPEKIDGVRRARALTKVIGLLFGAA